MVLYGILDAVHPSCTASCTSKAMAKILFLPYHFCLILLFSSVNFPAFIFTLVPVFTLINTPLLFSLFFLLSLSVWPFYEYIEMLCRKCILKRLIYFVTN